MNWPTSEFWTFSLDVYARPEVAPICLKLQDEAGADVNILLLCLWLATLGKAPLSADILGRIERQVAPWRDRVTLPLRSARRALAQFADIAQAPALKAVAEQLELDSEHQAQLMLESFADMAVTAKAPGLCAAEAAAISIGNYLQMIAPAQAAALAEATSLLVQYAATP